MTQQEIIDKLKKRITVLEYLMEYEPSTDDFTRGVNSQRREELEMLKQLLANETKHTSADAYTKIGKEIKNERLPEDNKETECWEEYYQGWCGY